MQLNTLLEPQKPEWEKVMKRRVFWPVVIGLLLVNVFVVVMSSLDKKEPKVSENKPVAKNAVYELNMKVRQETDNPVEIGNSFVVILSGNNRGTVGVRAELDQKEAYVAPEIQLVIFDQSSWVLYHTRISNVSDITICSMMLRVKEKTKDGFIDSAGREYILVTGSMQNLEKDIVLEGIMRWDVNSKTFTFEGGRMGQTVVVGSFKRVEKVKEKEKPE